MLGINSSSFDPPSQGLRGVKLPAPWRNHIRVVVSELEDGDCQSIPVFSTEPIWDPIYLIEGDPPGPGFMFVDNVDDTTAAYASTLGYSQDELSRDPAIYQDLRPRYKRIAALADYVKNHTDGKTMIQTMLPGSDRPAADHSRPVGLLQLHRERHPHRFLHLCALPQDRGLRRARRAILRHQGGDLGRGRRDRRGRRQLFDLELRTRASRPPRERSASARLRPSGAVEFGWVIGGQGRMESTQKSGLALVSVPAWTNELSVHVDTGWVRGSGALAVTGSYDFTVPIPPDYEAFDAFVGGSRVRHEPRISNDLVARHQVLEACDDVSIIIPGFRLWRSTVVTLGSQVATRITVLPNMRGIIAKFENLFAANVPGADEQVKLRVWTSEGVDTAVATFSITPPRAGTANCDAASGNDNAGEVTAAARAPDR